MLGNDVSGTCYNADVVLVAVLGICVGVSVFGVVANDLFAIAVDMVRVDFGVTYRAEMDVVKAYAEDIGAMVGGMRSSVLRRGALLREDSMLSWSENRSAAI